MEDIRRLLLLRIVKGQSGQSSATGHNKIQQNTLMFVHQQQHKLTTSQTSTGIRWKSGCLFPAHVDNGVRHHIGAEYPVASHVLPFNYVGLFSRIITQMNRHIYWPANHSYTLMLTPSRRYPADTLFYPLVWQGLSAEKPLWHCVACRAVFLFESAWIRRPHAQRVGNAVCYLNWCYSTG